MDSPSTKEGSGAPKGACHPCPRCANKCAQFAPLIGYAAARPYSPPSPACGGGSERGHARLSALTLAALATGYYPDGSAPEPGFPKTDFASVLPAWPSCLRLSTHRADRSLCGRPGTQSRPGADGISARGHRPRFRLSGLPFRKGALNERGEKHVTEVGTIVKRRVAFTVTRSGPFVIGSLTRSASLSD